MSSQTIQIPYGKSTLNLHILSSNLESIMEPHERGQMQQSEQTLLAYSLAEPIGKPCLADIVNPDMKIAVITSDNTRPCPTARMLPPVLKDLQTAGIKPENITIIFALGLHRALTNDEIQKMIPAEIYENYHLVNHDPEDVVYLGKTSRGTSIEVFRPVVEADLRICLGNLELHYFAGFSGGAKAIIPGCTSAKTIKANHALMVQPGAKAGNCVHNPVRQDIEEAANLLGETFILNVVMNSDHTIQAAFAGDIIQAHRKGCQVVSSRSTVSQPRPADIVVASAGGFPKDINLYQAQKGLDNASHAVRDGGIIILVAECGEGFGNTTFEAWMQQASDPDLVLANIKENFVLGGHKAAAIAAILKRANVYLVSSIPEQSVIACNLTPYSDVNAALAAAISELGVDSMVLILPHSGSTLPLLASDQNDPV